MNEPNLIRKDTLTDKVINKQKRVLVIAVLCVLTLFIGSSYALLINFDKTDNVINFTTGNLNMTVTNSGDSLTLTELNGKLPESDETGLQNATPIVLTLTNTGTMNIMRYDVKLTKDTTKTSTLDEKYIKYAISLDNGTTYSSPSLLTENDNIIYTNYNLDVDQSKIVYLKLWIDENAGNYALNKEYYGSITVDLYQKSDIPGSVTMMEAITANTDASCNPIVTDTDGTIYFSGDNTCVDFNYVWYSGKLWRITAIYPDGTLKMVTDETITTISYGSDVNFYTDENNKSYVYQWLNEEFLDTLYNYENIIVTDYKWNATPTTNFSAKLSETMMINTNVGLLNSYEYYMSYQNADYTNGYLNIGNSHWLLNSYDSSNVFVAYYKGQIENRSPIEYMRGVRPSIKLKSNIQLKGEGTIDNPYKISGDKERVITNTSLLNTRTSGEYVSFDNELYRIVNIESNGNIKINKVDYLSGSKYLASTKIYGATSNTQSNDYWDYYLNNTWYNNISSEYKNMLVKGTYYLGIIENAAANYKASICKEASNAISIKNCEKTSSTWEGYVGLPRAGEMFASQLIKSTSAADFILITPSLPSHILHIIFSNNININSVETVNATVRPSLTISKEVVIKEGLGTKNNPFIVGLSEVIE